MTPRRSIEQIDKELSEVRSEVTGLEDKLREPHRAHASCWSRSSKR